MPYKCPIKRREYIKEYNRKNREKKALYDAKYRDKNSAKRKQQLADWKKRESEYSIWLSCRYRASRKGLDFEITPEDVIIPSHCPVLGIPMSIGGDKSNSPSIDRIDNSKGYIKDNIVVISHRANRLKSDASLEEIENLAKWLRKETNER